ncbi:hypothetical protein Hanom_Chr04g00310331 [Helianthus anomalus]
MRLLHLCIKVLSVAEPEILSKLQVLSFMFVSDCRRCPLSLNSTSFVLNVSKSCTLCHLALTQSDFFC